MVVLVKWFCVVNELGKEDSWGQKLWKTQIHLCDIQDPYCKLAVTDMLFCSQDKKKDITSLFIDNGCSRFESLHTQASTKNGAAVKVTLDCILTNTLVHSQAFTQMATPKVRIPLPNHAGTTTPSCLPSLCPHHARSRPPRYRSDPRPLGHRGPNSLGSMH